MPLAVSRHNTAAGTRVDLRLRADLDEVTALADELHRLGAGVAEDGAIADLELAVVEAANNIVLHALRGAAGTAFSAIISISPHELAVELVDDGPAIDPLAFDQPLPDDELATSGRGMAIMRAFTDQLDYRRDAGLNRLRLVKRVG